MSRGAASSRRSGSDSERSAIFSLLKKAEAKLRSNPVVASEISRQAMDIAKTSGIPTLLAESLAMHARADLLRGDRRASAEGLARAITIYESGSALDADLDAALEMRCLHAVAKLTTGNEERTLGELYEIFASRSAGSIENCRSWQDRVLGRTCGEAESLRNSQIQLATVYDAVGFAYIVLREHHKAASFLEESHRIFKALISERNPKSPKLEDRATDRRRLANAINNLGYVHALLGNRVVALEYCQLGLKLSRELKDEYGIAINQRNLAQLYLHTGQVTLGKRFAMKSYETAKRLSMPEAASRALVTLTKYERLHGSLQRASSLTEKALKLLNPKDHAGPYYYFKLQELLIAHAESPSRATYKQMLALHQATAKQGLELQHEVSQEIARVAEELRLLPEAVKWSRKVHEYELERLHREQRSALLSIKNEQEVERLAREREHSKLLMENLSLQLRAKENEAKLLAVQLAKKGSFLASLTSQIEAMAMGSTTHSKPTIDAVVKLIETTRFRDKDYEQLEERAELLHHDYLVALSNRYPDLTATEKKICTLLKLGLTTTDLANVLFASPRTIESHTLSIRKKLRIPAATRLAKFLSEDPFAV